MVTEISERELRRKCLDAAGSGWFAMPTPLQGPWAGFLAEIETCDVERLVEIAFDLGVLK